MNDYKYNIPVIAEEVALDRYEQDYYALDQTTQERLYEEAMKQYFERISGRP